MTTLVMLTQAQSAAVVQELRRLEPKRNMRVWTGTGPTDDVRHVIAFRPPPGILKRFSNLELILSYGAGVDHFLADPELPKLPLVRFVDPDLTQRMTEYLVLHTLLHHRRMTEYLELQRAARWHEYEEPSASDVRVGIMGLGVLGTDAARKLKGLGYQVAGWSRSQRSIDGIETFQGADGLAPFLARTEILIAVLPLTRDTRGLINAWMLASLARDGQLPGPVLINAGRGGLHVEPDVIAALATGDLYAATLDVFETEPLPRTSPLWQHPRVIITPHNASNSMPKAVAAHVLRQIGRHERGEPLENLVDLARGY